MGLDRWMEYQPLDELVPDPKNVKEHDSESLAGSMRRFGYVELVAIDERTQRLISGHGRREELLARRERGEEPPDGVKVDDEGNWLVPVSRGWESKDDDEAAAALVALNRIGERGGWDKPGLAELLADLAGTDAGLDGIGYTPVDLDDLLASIQESDVAFDPVDSGGTTNPARKEETYEEWGQNYRNKQVRSMVFDYPLDQYEYVVGVAARARHHYGLESNAELFASLLQDFAEAHPEDGTSEPAEAAETPVGA